MADKPSVTHGIVITARRHIKPFDLISVSNTKESGGCREVQISTNGNLTFTAAILPHVPAYSGGAKKAESERKR